MDDYLERGPSLVGSPQEVIDKIFGFHAVFGHQVQAISVDMLSSRDYR
jgi:alkanesulfonate monooxygenase SsuD/methylene tetrahydromethanopterin reductase-like flavin-dependent oxidoreductase (luciferase family)